MAPASPRPWTRAATGTPVSRSSATAPTSTRRPRAPRSSTRRSAASATSTRATSPTRSARSATRPTSRCGTSSRPPPTIPDEADIRGRRQHPKRREVLSERRQQGHAPQLLQRVDRLRSLLSRSADAHLARCAAVPEVRPRPLQPQDQHLARRASSATPARATSLARPHRSCRATCRRRPRPASTARSARLPLLARA